MFLTGFELRSTHFEHRALTTPPDVLPRTSKRYLPFYIVTVIIGLKWYILCLPRRISNSLITKKRVIQLINRKPGENHHIRPVKTRHNGRAGYTHKNTHMLSKRKASSRLQFSVYHYTSTRATPTPPLMTLEKSTYLKGLWRERRIESVCARHRDTTSESVFVWERSQ